MYLLRSFAIRIDTAITMINQLIKQGKVMRPFLGIHTTSFTPAVWKQLEEHSTIPRVPGILVTEVMDDSPAFKCGLQVLELTYLGWRCHYLS